MDDTALSSSELTPTTGTTAERSAHPSRRAGRSWPALAVFFLVALVVFGADMAIKHYAFQDVAEAPVVVNPRRPGHSPIPRHAEKTLIPHVLSLQLTTNAGAVFGLAQGRRWVFIVVTVVAVAFIIRIFWRSPARALGMHVALALILAGALGNLYDRVRFSAVRDMFHLFPDAMLPFGWTWPNGSQGLYPWIFNLADAALVVGVVSVLAITWIGELRRPKPR